LPIQNRVREEFDDLGVKLPAGLLGVRMNGQLGHAMCRLGGALLCTFLLTALGVAHSQAGLTYRDGVTTPPVLTHFVRAEYTQEARNARYVGSCIVFLIVDEHGDPQNVHVTRPLGMGLDESAIKAVKQERFKPATRGGCLVAFPLSMKVNFRMTP
jgi:TonB family protein